MLAARYLIGTVVLSLAALSSTACTDRASTSEQNQAAPAPVETAPPEVANIEAEAGKSPTAAAAQTSDAGACHQQDGKPIAPAQLQAIGTEPFWNARIDGRCVSYSTPENQAGTRIWTQFSGSAETGTWSGALGGRQFELRTRQETGCSDGMSDNRYPLAVTLRVGGETRQGCARPA